MPTITRQSFNQHLEGKSLDVDALKADPRLAGLDIDKADINGDGKISGPKETDKLYLEVDNYDRNGTYSSMDASNPDVAKPMAAGSPTRSR